jgi:hypothetical protein
VTSEGRPVPEVRGALAAIATWSDSQRLRLTWDQGPEMRDWKLTEGTR